MQHGGDVQRDETTGEEIAGTAIPSHGVKKDGQLKTTTNAFSELMSKKPKPLSPKKASQEQRVYFNARDGLGAYTADPAAFGPERMIYYNDKFAVIHDLYPKASIHTLVLPADTQRNYLHPFDAFDDPDLLAATKVELEKTKDIVASELRRRFGNFSATEQARIKAMESDDVLDELPPGRDWKSEIKSGIHAHPSMSHVHVHVFSPDMVSPFMTHRKHYESFNTKFLVPLDAFPLAKDDPRRHPNRSGYLNQDLRCWRCGENFGNKFAKLKTHLEAELEEWKKI